MNLNYKQIDLITEGAVRIEEKNGEIHFYRFTRKQEELYKNYNSDFYKKTFSTPGVKFNFRTDSKKLYLKFAVSRSTTRTYFSFDVFKNKEYLGSMDNLPDEGMKELYPKRVYELGEFEKEFSLGGGEKNITVYFPFSVAAVLKEVSIDDGAYIEPIKREKKLLMFGDSITHGYDTIRPSGSYSAKLADALDADVLNKGIGGERFFPELAKLKDDFEPDYITVAYGTNDWSTMTDKSQFEYNCREFYDNLSKNYPNSIIFAITPIWRKDFLEEKPLGKFNEIAEYIESVTKKLENVVCIRGFDLVPHEEKYFGDLYLHPSDEGFEHYFKNLYREIKKYI